ncbi:MAG TPA: hypothetical protein V6C81_11755 [Planktothrix sp.]|jgi:hypothetical protein
MEYLITVAILSGIVWLSVEFSRRAKGKQLLEQMRLERDQVVWGAARKVGLELKSSKIAEAEKSVRNATEKLRTAASTLSVRDYEHASVDVKLAEDDLQTLLARDQNALRAYQAVSSYYHNVMSECERSPKRAIRLYPTMTKRVNDIVMQIVGSVKLSRPKLRLIRGGKDTPISQDELDDFSKALHDGRFDTWVNNLEV